MGEIIICHTDISLLSEEEKIEKEENKKIAIKNDLHAT